MLNIAVSGEAAAVLRGWSAMIETVIVGLVSDERTVGLGKFERSATRSDCEELTGLKLFEIGVDPWQPPRDDFRALRSEPGIH